MLPICRDCTGPDVLFFILILITSIVSFEIIMLPISFSFSSASALSHLRLMLPICQHWTSCPDVLFPASILILISLSIVSFEIIMLPICRDWTGPDILYPVSILILISFSIVSFQIIMLPICQD